MEPSDELKEKARLVIESRKNRMQCTDKITENLVEKLIPFGVMRTDSGNAIFNEEFLLMNVTQALNRIMPEFQITLSIRKYDI